MSIFYICKLIHPAQFYKQLLFLMIHVSTHIQARIHRLFVRICRQNVFTVRS